MTSIGTLQIILYLCILLLLVKPLGWYMARVYEGKPCGLDRLLSPLERLTYRLCRIVPQQEMNWKVYLVAMLLFNLLGMLLVYLLQRMQGVLPLNPQAFANESSLSYLTQMLALTVQNFLSAATGMAILVAFTRGLIRHETHALGNFWVDTVRGTLYILLPLSIVFAVFLSSQGVIQNINPYQQIHTLQSTLYIKPIKNHVKIKIEPRIEQPAMTQVIPMGLVASQVAIKQLGSNGGGFFNVNSAHPFENPNVLTNFFEMLALLLIPTALCYTYGMMVGDTRQGWSILLAMLFIFVPATFLTSAAELQANSKFAQMGIMQTPILNTYPGGNMEGKETRFGINSSTLWAVSTTATGNGSVNSMLDSFMPLAGMVPLWLIQLSEVIFGGVGSGLYGMLIFVILTVFVAGLMVGRTPEYLGKKIQPYEMKMASFTVLIVPTIILILTAIGAVTSAGTNAIANSGPHGFTEILYAFSSMANNNGSAFAGVNANTLFYNVCGAFAMLIGRYWVAISVLAIAGSLVIKKPVPSSAGTLPTHNLLFIILLSSVVLVFGALTFFPALALGPIVEQLMLWGRHVG
jgi:K+-transporting ATPase ATPase A chain